MLDHLPERDRSLVKSRLRKAWASENHQQALDALGLLASELEHSHPGAAASLREGMTETLTLTRLGVRGKLKTTLQSTNPIESMIGTVRHTSRNVKALAKRRHVPPVDRPPECSKPRPSSAESPATKTSRSSPSNATSPPAARPLTPRARRTPT